MFFVSFVSSGVLFYLFFIFDIFVTSESMYIVMKTQKIVAYAFESESTLYSCLHVKEFLASNRRDISNLSDCKGTRNHNHLSTITTQLNQLVSLAKCLSVRLQTNWLWVRVRLHSLNFQISRLF